MEQRTVGRSGLRVSRLGLATHTWGRETDAEDAAAQLMAFVEAGGTLVDTSPAYGDGAAQHILGELVSEIGREDLVLAGNAGYTPILSDAAADAPAAVRWTVDASRRTMMRQLDHTLTQLGTDHLDLWTVAAWDPHTPSRKSPTPCRGRCARAGSATPGPAATTAGSWPPWPRPPR